MSDQGQKNISSFFKVVDKEKDEAHAARQFAEPARADEQDDDIECVSRSVKSTSTQSALDRWEWPNAPKKGDKQFLVDIPFGFRAKIYKLWRYDSRVFSEEDDFKSDPVALLKAKASWQRITERLSKDYIRVAFCSLCCEPIKFLSSTNGKLAPNSSAR